MICATTTDSVLNTILTGHTIVCTVHMIYVKICFQNIHLYVNELKCGETQHNSWQYYGIDCDIFPMVIFGEFFNCLILISRIYILALRVFGDEWWWKHCGCIKLETDSQESASLRLTKCVYDYHKVSRQLVFAGLTGVLIFGSLHESSVGVLFGQKQDFGSYKCLPTVGSLDVRITTRRCTPLWDV